MKQQVETQQSHARWRNSAHALDKTARWLRINDAPKVIVTNSFENIHREGKIKPV
jgi:hypothetical protein